MHRALTIHFIGVFLMTLHLYCDLTLPFRPHSSQLRIFTKLLISTSKQREKEAYLRNVQVANHHFKFSSRKWSMKS